MSVPVPKLRFKNFSQALINGPFEQYIKSSKYGPRFDANDYDLNGNVKTIRGTDVALDATIKYEQVPIANLPQKLIDEHQLQEGDILMITTADCGLSAVFEKQEIPFIASAYAVRIVLKNSLDSLWVKYYLQTQHIVNEVNKYVRKGTLSNLPLSDISKFSFTVPALEEQTKIATFLSAVDEKISQLTQKHELLSQYKQGMMQKLFSQQIRFKADDGSEFGEWEEKTLIDSVDTNIKWSFTGGPFGSNLKSEDYTELGIRIIQLQNIGDGAFLNDYKIYTSPEKANELLSCNIYPDEILISKMGDPVARCCIVPKHHDRYVMCSDGIRLVVDKQNYSSIFMFYQINYQDFRQSASDVSTGSTRKRIGLSDLKQLPIKAPCLEEQTKIANFLSAIDQKIEVVAQQIEQAKQWKKGLLQQMFV